MASRHESPAPEDIGGVKRGRGEGGEPSEWTGWASHAKNELLERPEFRRLTLGTSPRKRAEVTEPWAAQKSR